jgi:hypothetical protein
MGERSENASAPYAQAQLACAYGAEARSVYGGMANRKIKCVKRKVESICRKKDIYYLNARVTT